MTSTPNLPLGERVVWIVCDGPNDETQCDNYIPADPGTPTVADWGTATAVFGEKEAYRLYGRRITAILINRILDPNYVPNPNLPTDPGYDPNYPEQGTVEIVLDTYTDELLLDSPQRSQLHPAIETYDGESGLQSVCGIIDGTYYVYPVVFDNAEFCYLPRCSGQYPSGSNIERCLQGEGTFPLEPLDTSCTPIPVYPMDAITKWSPSPDPYRDIAYTATWKYYRGNEPTGELQETSIDLTMRVYPPPNNWDAMEATMRAYTYFYNGIYH